MTRICLEDFLEFPVKKTVRSDRRPRVVAPRLNKIRSFAVEIGDTRQKAVNSVARLNSRPGIIAPFQAVIAARNGKINRVEFSAVARKHREIFWSFKDEAFKRFEVIFLASRRRPFIYEKIRERFSIFLRKRIFIFWRNVPAFFESFMPFPRNDFLALVPFFENFDKMGAVRLAAANKIVLVRNAFFQVFLRNRYESLGFQASVLVENGHFCARSGFYSHF